MTPTTADYAGLVGQLLSATINVHYTTATGIEYATLPVETVIQAAVAIQALVAERDAGSRQTPDREMQPGAAYAIESPVEITRLDWLARHGHPSNVTETEVRFMAEEVWQKRHHAEFMPNIALCGPSGGGAR